MSRNDAGEIRRQVPVLSTDRAATLAKLYLMKTLRAVFRDGLNILGVSAPEQMSRGEEA